MFTQNIPPFVGRCDCKNLPTRRIWTCSQSGRWGWSDAAIALPLGSSQRPRPPVETLQTNHPVEASSLYCTFKVVQLKTNTADISNKINTRTKIFLHLFSPVEYLQPSGYRVWTADLSEGRKPGFAFGSLEIFLVKWHACWGDVLGRDYLVHLLSQKHSRQSWSTLNITLSHL